MSTVKAYDCEPTLTDSQVLQFCQDGYLILKGVVPDEINKKSLEFLQIHTEHTPTPMLDEDWFVDNVITNPEAAGAIRSLLGKNFQLTMPFMANHRSDGPQPAQNWHKDGGFVHTPALDSLQVFYYPQDTPLEMGPTEVIPGSHLLYSTSPFMRHYSSIKQSVSTAAPAGSIVLTVYSIWHRRATSTAHGTRHLLKYWYMRTSGPERDWINEPGFDLMHAYHPSNQNSFHREGHRARNETAEMFFWLCGKHDDFRAWEHNLPVYYYEEKKLCKFCGYKVT